MRHVNHRELSDREEELTDIWFELIDSSDPYYSPRIQISTLVDDFILSIEKENYGDFKSLVDNIRQELENISENILDELGQDIESALPEIEAIENNRNELKQTLKQAVDFDGAPIYELDDWWIDEDKVKSRIYSQTTAHADARIFEDIRSDGGLKDWNKIRSEIGSGEVINDFRQNLVSSIEGFLNEREQYSRTNLKSIIESLFAELRYQNWTYDDFEKVIKIYIKYSGEELDKIRSNFLDKINQNTTSNVTFVALPDAHLGDLTPLKVGQVTFHSISDQNFNLESKKHPALANVDFSEQSDIWASVEVSGGTTNIRVKNLKEKVARAVDILNLGKSSGLLQFPFDKSYTVLQQASSGQVQLLQAKNDLSQMSYSNFADEKRVKERIRHFEEYLLAVAESPLEESISSSIRWYRYANRSPEDEESFLKYIIAIESLLVSGEVESKSDNIADRGVSLLQLHTEHRQDYYDFFEEVYRIRSQIVHTGARDLPEFQQQLDKLERLTGRLISTAQEYSGGCESIHEVVEKIEAEEDKIKADKIEKSPFEPGERFNLEATLFTAGGGRLSEVQLDGEMKDDSRYVYYEADISDGDYKTDTLDPNYNYELKFEVNGDEYIGRDVAFPESSLSDAFYNTTQPGKIRWYEIEEAD